MEEIRQNTETDKETRLEGEVLDRLASDPSGQQYFAVEGMGTLDLSEEEKDTVKAWEILWNRNAWLKSWRWTLTV